MGKPYKSLMKPPPRAKARPKPPHAHLPRRAGRPVTTGVGSRLRLWECRCPKPVKVRVASDTFDATCGKCNQPFEWWG